MKNYCYDCGVLIDTGRHFCDKECSDNFFKKHGDKAPQKLAQITKARKKSDVPHYGKETEMDEDKKEYGWDEFVKYAREVGIGLDHEDDWADWWDCWKRGYKAGKE